MKYFKKGLVSGGLLSLFALANTLMWHAVGLSQLEGKAVESDTILSIALSPDGKLVAGGSFDKTIKIWDAQTGKHVRTLWGYGGTVRRVAFSPDSKTVAGASDDGTTRLWDANSWEVRRRFEEPKGDIITTTSLAFSPDGMTLAIVNRAISERGTKTDFEAKLWDVNNGKLKRMLKKNGKGVSQVAFSVDGKTLAAAGEELQLWDADTGHLKKTLKIDDGGTFAVAYSPDGKTLVTAGSHLVVSDGEKTPVFDVKFWNADTGAVVRTIENLPRPVHCVAFSPNGKTIAGGCEGKWRKNQFETKLLSAMKIWDVGSGKLLLDVDGDWGQITSLAFSPDGKDIVYCDYEVVAIIDAQSGQRKHVLHKTRLFGR